MRSRFDLGGARLTADTDLSETGTAITLKPCSPASNSDPLSPVSSAIEATSLARKSFDEMTSRNPGDDKILSYGDVVLRSSDLAILRGPHFLNDRLIEFFFAHLSSSSPSNSKEVLLVPPSISFWLAHCPDNASLREAAEPLQLPQKDLILFVVNNNTDVTAAEGGTHWSTLVYDRESDEFVHHDSSRGLNRRHAERLAERLKGFVGDDEGGRFVEAFTPQQENGYDCGLFVMSIARVVCGWCAEGGGDGEEGERWFVKMKEEVDAAAVAKLRGEVLGLILGLMEK